MIMVYLPGKNENIIQPKWLEAPCVQTHTRVIDAHKTNPNKQNLRDVGKKKRKKPVEIFLKI